MFLYEGMIISKKKNQKKKPLLLVSDNLFTIRDSSFIILVNRGNSGIGHDSSYGIVHWTLNGTYITQTPCWESATGLVH